MSTSIHMGPADKEQLDSSILCSSHPAPVHSAVKRFIIALSICSLPVHDDADRLLHYPSFLSFHPCRLLRPCRPTWLDWPRLWCTSSPLVASLPFHLKSSTHASICRAHEYVNERMMLRWYPCLATVTGSIGEVVQYDIGHDEVTCECGQLDLPLFTELNAIAQHTTSTRQAPATDTKRQTTLHTTIEQKQRSTQKRNEVMDWTEERNEEDRLPSSRRRRRGSRNLKWLGGRHCRVTLT